MPSSAHLDDGVSPPVDKGIHDLLALSSLFSSGIDADQFLASESRLIRSKLQRLFQHLLTDAQCEPVTQASGDQISTSAHVDDALLSLNRHATLKFRNYKHFREQFLASSNERRDTPKPSEKFQDLWAHFRQSTVPMGIQQDRWFRSKNVLRHLVHWLIHTRFFTWFISIAICVDAISVGITTEYSAPDDSKSLVYIIAMAVNRCILFIYLFEIIFKWIDDFTNFWYSAVDILEFVLTVISLINLISEIYIDRQDTSNLSTSGKFDSSNSRAVDTLQRIRSYGSVLALLRTLRMLRILRILEIAFRFAQVRIVFLALSRSVKLIFHVVFLTLVLNYFFALIGLSMTQFGLNTASEQHMKTINALFGTVPRAFITVFRIFTKDEWYEIKLEMYALNISPIIIDAYVITWLFFGGYVLNPLLIGAMVGTFEETRTELTQGIKQIISKTRLTFNQTTSATSQSSTSILSSLLAHIDSIQPTSDSLFHGNNKLDEWLRMTSDEIRSLTQDRIETRWPIYSAFSYLQLLEIYYENIAERQLLFDFFSISLLALHDRETPSIDPPILSSSDDDE